MDSPSHDRRRCRQARNSPEGVAAADGSRAPRSAVALPISAAGKILKRELRAMFVQSTEKT
jgi:hypothetical protein